MKKVLLSFSLPCCTGLRASAGTPAASCSSILDCCFQAADDLISHQPLAVSDQGIDTPFYCF